MIASYALWNLCNDTVTGQIEKAMALGFTCFSFRRTPPSHQQPGDENRVIKLIEGRYRVVQPEPTSEKLLTAYERLDRAEAA